MTSQRSLCMEDNKRSLFLIMWWKRVKPGEREREIDIYSPGKSPRHIPKQAKETSPESDPRKSAILLDSSTWDFPHWSYRSLFFSLGELIGKIPFFFFFFF